MKNQLYFTGLLVFSLIFFSCVKDEEVVPAKELNDLHLISEQSVPQMGLDLALYAEKEELFTGYNYLYFQLKDAETGEAYDLARLTVTPLMDMGNMVHSAPVEDFNYNIEKEAYEGAIVFVMPGPADSWKISITIEGEENGQTSSMEIPVAVVSPDEPRLLSFLHQETSYFISLVEPKKPQVGVNEFEIALHKRAGMMDWPAVENFTFSIVPEMPAMGHGSPNNIDPVHVGNGHYRGKVNFTMDGYWKIHLNPTVEGTEVSEDLSFDITFSEKAD